MTLIISSMCPRCKSWQRLQTGKGKCEGCGYNFYDGNIYASAFQETDTTMKRHCKKCDHDSWFLPDGSCPNCTHNDNQGRVAWNHILTEKEIDIFMNLTPEEMRVRLGEKAKDFVAANDAIRFPPLSLAFDSQKLNAAKPIKIETNKCPMCLANTLPEGKCVCGFDFDDFIARNGSFPEYNYKDGGWVFGKDIAYDGSSFNANTIVEKVCKSCEVPNLPKVHARIQELKAIRDIADHYIKVPSDEHMDKLNLLLQAFYPKCIEDDLLIFPTSIPNKIRLEWQIGQYDISLEINMDNLKGYYHCLNLQTERCEEERHMLHDQKSWEILTDRIRWIDRW
jgi:hypothetical protein